MFLTSLLCIILTAINASAYDFEVDGIYYNIISNVDLTVEVTNKYKGSFDSNYSYSGSTIYRCIILQAIIILNQKLLTR